MCVDVDGENDDSWEWFCLKLRDALRGAHCLDRWEEYTFFSDRLQGLLKAIATVFEGSNHAHCVRHLADNFKTQVLYFVVAIRECMCK